ncbi:hypothetical protein QIU18_01910 [Capnocytophaga canimorsus]|nr:hypothetical protein [Capnocytophaga canimorsus]WGU70856.1 hypothetical protein QIU18_01910 [Capnocytophaga canimorsus]
MGFDFSKGFVLGSDAELDISQLLKKRRLYAKSWRFVHDAK